MTGPAMKKNKAAGGDLHWNEKARKSSKGG